MNASNNVKHNDLNNVRPDLETLNLQSKDKKSKKNRLLKSDPHFFDKQNLAEENDCLSDLSLKEVKGFNRISTIKKVRASYTINETLDLQLELFSLLENYKKNSLVEEALSHFLLENGYDPYNYPTKQALSNVREEPKPSFPNQEPPNIEKKKKKVCYVVAETINKQLELFALLGDRQRNELVEEALSHFLLENGYDPYNYPTKLTIS